MFSEQHLETQEENELIDDEEKAASIARLKKLKMADDRTKNMTREYVHWVSVDRRHLLLERVSVLENGPK